jgi:hypothetical protein
LSGALTYVPALALGPVMEHLLAVGWRSKCWSNIPMSREKLSSMFNPTLVKPAIRRFLRQA